MSTCAWGTSMPKVMEALHSILFLVQLAVWSRKTSGALPTVAGQGARYCPPVPTRRMEMMWRIK